jgi:hypothetical protein
MKKTLSLITILSLCLNSFAQKKEIRILSIHRVTRPMSISQCDLKGTESGSTVDVPANYRIIVQNITNNGIVVAFLKWTNFRDGKDGKKTEQGQANYDLNQKYRGSQAFDPKFYFFIPNEDFIISTEEVINKAGLVVGTATTLMKYRPGSNSRNPEIGNDINIGGLLGTRFTANPYVNLYGLLGLNIGAVKLTPNNTRNTITEEINEFAFTPTAGFVIEVKGTQLGIFTGIDIASGSAYKSWIYRGRPWIGFGIGIGIFKENPSDKNSEKKQN